jgi:tRNA(Ile)-lysidine synthase TilS/MesJ
MRELTLKELAPYLAYNLGIYCKNAYPLVEFTMNAAGGTGYIAIREVIEAEMYKPILRPMSDLTRKELEAEYFEDHIDFLTNEFNHWIEKYGCDHVVNETPYGHVQYLLSEHYDIYGLISAGLAISIHDLKA